MMDLYLELLNAYLNVKNKKHFRGGVGTCVDNEFKRPKE